MAAGPVSEYGRLSPPPDIILSALAFQVEYEFAVVGTAARGSF